MKILRLGEGLTDEARSNDLAANRNEATIGLLRENQLGHTGHHGGVQQSGENRKNQCQTKSRSKFLQHVLLLYSGGLVAAATARTLTRDAAPRASCRSAKCREKAQSSRQDHR